MSDGVGCQPSLLHSVQNGCGECIKIRPKNCAQGETNTFEVYIRCVKNAGNKTSWVLILVLYLCFSRKVMALACSPNSLKKKCCKTHPKV